MRLLTFPLVIMAQKNAARVANYAPEMQVPHFHILFLKKNPTNLIY